MIACVGSKIRTRDMNRKDVC